MVGNRRTRVNRTISSNECVAGFDLSLTATGVVILSLTGRVLKRQIIKPKVFGAERLNYIQKEIRALMSGLNIKLVCIEGYSTGSTNGKTFHIGELGGVVRLLLYRQGIKYMDPKPTQLKKFATGMGGGPNGSKDQVTMFAYKDWGFQPTDNNEADAFILAQIALGLIGKPSKPLKKYQKEVIGVILDPPEKKPKKKKEE